MEVITTPAQKTYRAGDKVIITGLVMIFSHYIITPNGQVPFFHYYINGEQFGYINHDLTQAL